MKTETKPEPKIGARTKLLDAAVTVIRTRGYTASTVDDICQAAGVTKGGFFHHFQSKEEIGVAAAAHFASNADTRFAAAAYRELADPVDRLLGYVDFRKAILRGDLWRFTCLLGTMVQETYHTHPNLREACERHIVEHADTLTSDIAEAMASRRVTADAANDFTAESLALHMQAVIQGAFILAKATQKPEVAADCLDHLRRYLELLFRPNLSEEQRPCAN